MQDELPTLAKLDDVWIRRAGLSPSTPELSAEPRKSICPICGASGRFLPFGMANRPNAQCPTCGSLERHRMLWLYLSQHTDLLRASCRVLHTSPVPCLESRLRSVHEAGYVSSDRYSRTVDVAADVSELPFSDGKFDFVISSHVLEHLEDDQRAISELSRVVRPGGNAIIMVPLDPSRLTHGGATLGTPMSRLAAHGHPFHYRIYGPDLAERFGSAGLTCQILASPDLFSPAQRRLYRINVNHLLSCQKNPEDNS